MTGELEYNRAEELKAFDDTKKGVKGLVDLGLKKIPKIFIRQQPDENQKSDELDHHSDIQIPVIDLQGDHQEVIDKIMKASREWGFFQIVNHGVPLSVLDEMIKGVIRFNEQDDGVKQKYHSRDRTKKVRYNSNRDLYVSEAAYWRDTLTINIIRSDPPMNPEELPTVCRDITIEYTKQVTVLGDTLFELLSEGLGLKPDHLKKMNCTESINIIPHYYPACPEPELTLGIPQHTDVAFLTILLQNNIGGLQVFHKDHWVDIHPTPGALVVNIGDLLQITSNDRLKSVEHRVLANNVGPRISVACFLTTRYDDAEAEPNGPIKELIADGSLPVYRQFSNKEYIDYFFAQGHGGKRALEHFKL